MSQDQIHYSYFTGSSVFLSAFWLYGHSSQYFEEAHINVTFSSHEWLCGPNSKVNCISSVTKLDKERISERKYILVIISHSVCALLLAPGGSVQVELYSQMFLQWETPDHCAPTHQKKTLWVVSRSSSFRPELYVGKWWYIDNLFVVSLPVSPVRIGISSMSLAKHCTDSCGQGSYSINSSWSTCQHVLCATRTLPTALKHLLRTFCDRYPKHFGFYLQVAASRPSKFRGCEHLLLCLIMYMSL